ncbi:MAG: AAA family ATPase [Saprospiraceae bacterium]|nr:AAA family ATPase [Saprospiraceae bacterium]
MSQILNQILYGPPGTGKTYNTINKALEILGQKFESEDRATIKRHFDEKVKEGQIMFTTFHQSMSYEDFIEGIKPIKPSSDDEFLKYDIEDGIFKKLCVQAGMKQQTNFRAAYDQFITQTTQKGNELVEMKTPSQKIFHVNVNSNDNLSLFTGADKTKQGVLTWEKLEKHALGYKVFKGWQGYASGVLEYLRLNFNLQVVEQVEDKKYVLIIDEINRGNVSSIFGELITLIEEDKRQGKPEALEVILPYSKDKFSVPQNIYILGTMNTADRSVEALDAALRRRFSFTEMPPVPELIAREGKLKDHGGILGNVNLPRLLTTINQRIEKLLDKDHTIGHSYFMKVASLEDLKSSFQHEIIPSCKSIFMEILERSVSYLAKVL